MIINSNESHGISLGYPFDHLFDRECELGPGTEIGPSVRAIKLPSKDGLQPGTGNIVITGPPGSGKSTLALQWAVKCALREDNQSNAAYFSLETSMDEMVTKAKPFLWHIWLREMQNLDPGDQFLGADGLGKRLMNLLKIETADERRRRVGLKKSELGSFDNGDKTRRVLLCSLSPRSLLPDTDHEELFWRRYQQVERLLEAAHHLSTRDYNDRDWKRFINSKAPAGPKKIVLPMIVLDSLNMFGSRPLNRDEVFRIFSLFRKYQRVGVFVVEATQDSPFDSTMADVVISLTHERDRGYLVQHFEVEKSRYFNQVTGLHPYKTLSLFSEKQRETKTKRLPPMSQEGSEPNVPRQGIVVYPSLHYIVLRTERKEDVNPPKSTGEKKNETPSPRLIEEPKYFGISALKTILPIGLPRGSVLTLEGPRGTFKTSVALNFLGTGLREGESVLLIRFSDVSLLKESVENKKRQMIPPRMSRELAESDFKWEQWHRWSPDRPEPKENGYWSGLAAPQKMTMSVWRRAKTARSRDIEPSLFEMDFKGGMLMPEEFVEIIRNLFIRRFRDEKRRIKRVVLDDVSQIGVSYPFLRQSITTGDTFLSAFVHIMRNLGVDLLMTGTTGGVGPADEIVSRACSLADAVVSFRFRDVFGARHVVVSGEGLLAGKGESSQPGESPPAVVRFGEKEVRGNKVFEVDCEHLQGLVGFDTGSIQRPGLVIHLFQGNGKVHETYNNGIKAMLEAGFASSTMPEKPTDPVGSGRVEMITFQANESDAIHGAVDSFHRDGRPLDRTVLYTVDEFGAPLNDVNPATAQWIKVPPDEGLNWKEFLLSKNYANWPGLVWPYYSNVLFLAYRIDGSSSADRQLRQHKHVKSWTEVERLTRIVLANSKQLSVNKARNEDGEIVPSVKRGFWIDLSASETLSCVLLDALQAAHKCADKQFNFLTNGERRRHKQIKLESDERAEVLALTKLFQRTGRITDIDKQLLPDDAGVYVCWYSQLRELIQREPALATKLNVCALPGGGFRGDWFAGIVKGSVSPALGRRIINTLCRMEEDHKRYTEGVGMPTRSLFYKEEFYAWPRAEHVTLARLKGIWQNALRRGEIGRNEDYQRIRSDISEIARQLTVLAGPVTKRYFTPERLLKTVKIERLFTQIPELLRTS